MFKSILRNSVLGLAAIAGIAASIPSAQAGGRGEPEVIYVEEGQVRRHWQEDHRFYRDVLSEREVARALRHQGYRQVREISLRGDRYRVVAIRHNGAVVKLRVDAFSGQVLSQVRVGWVRTRPVAEPLPFPHRPRHGSGVSIEFGWESPR